MHLMAVPDFQSMMLPLLEAIADGAEHSNAAAYELVAKRMNVAAEDLQLMHSGGEQTVFYNRVAWGKTYLKKGGLLKSPKRGTIQITESGREVLKNKPQKIDLRFLKQIGGPCRWTGACHAPTSHAHGSPRPASRPHGETRCRCWPEPDAIRA